MPLLDEGVGRERTAPVVAAGVANSSRPGMVVLLGALYGLLG